jgi:hypothetical protein
MRDNGDGRSLDFDAGAFGFAHGFWDWVAPSGLDNLGSMDPGRCPGLVWCCAVGAEEWHPLGLEDHLDKPFSQGREYGPEPVWTILLASTKWSETATDGIVAFMIRKR